MTSAFIGATVVVALYSLWVRRDTWWSRWEIGVTLAITLEICALVLLSPWAAETFGTMLHRVARVWNVQQLAGHICLMLAIAANIYHVLVRLADVNRVRPLFRRQVQRPIQVGVIALAAVFVVADADYRPHGFAGSGTGVWVITYWVLVCGLLIYLAGYATRLLLMLRSDPRARETVELYTASSGFGMAAIVAQLSTTWTHTDVGHLVWMFICLAVGIFVYGSARSWQAKAAWFTASDRPIKESQPPPALS